MFTPEWKGSIEGWVKNYNHKHHWKVQRSNSRDDLMQEAYLVFLRVSRRYPDLETPQHFMALFKTAWHNQMTNMANEDTQSRMFCQMPTYQDDDEATQELDPAGDRDNDGYLSVMISQAPAEVTAVLNLMLNAPQELIDVAMSGFLGVKDRSCLVGGSRKICKMLGLDPKLDVLQMVEAYFRH